MPVEEPSHDSATSDGCFARGLMRYADSAAFNGQSRGLLIVAVVSITAVAGVPSVEWTGSRELHTVMETIATVLAFVIGILTLVRFYANGSAIHVHVGAGFVGVGLLDAAHAFLTSEYFATTASSATGSLVLGSWNASRIFLGGVLVLSCRAQDRQDESPENTTVQPVTVYVTVLTLSTLCLAFSALVPWPSGDAIGMAGGPEELISGSLFLLAVWQLIRRGVWRRSPFSYWLLASSIVAVVMQLLVLSRSAQMFDARFVLAHVMKIVSYGLALFGVIQNIHILYRTSERMAAQAAQSEAKLRGIIDQAFNFIGLLSREGILLDGNRTALDAAGVSASDVLGKPFWETPWWAHSTQMQERLKEAVRRANAGLTDRFEATHQTADGSLIYVDFTLKPLRDDSGEIIFLVPEGRDITEQKSAVDALVTAELRLENALDGAEIGVWDWNVVTDEVFVSPQLTAQLGAAQRWTSLSDWVDHLHPEDRETAQGVIANYLSGEIPEYENTFRLRHVDGSYRSILSRGQLLRDDSGEPLRMVGVHIDITERVEQQKLLAEQAEELRKSNTELEQFAYVASHDLQEPLRAVSGYAQLLLQNYADSLDEKGRGFAERTVDGAQRMQKLISDLLEYSRVSRKGMTFQQTSLLEAVHTAQALLDASIRESRAVIHVSDLPIVMADSGQIVRLFQNLIGNAIKYRSDDQPEIEISAERDLSDAMWVIRVKDNGLGIAEEYAERVFVIFQRLHARAEFPGTGIGLAICRRIVERHGGRIFVEPNSDGGSTFVFTLPDAGVPDTPAASAADLPAG